MRKQARALFQCVLAVLPVMPVLAVLAGPVPAIHAGPTARAFKSPRQPVRVHARITPAHDGVIGKPCRLDARQAMSLDPLQTAAGLHPAARADRGE
ncbi:MAG: hypothetical protein B7Y95_13175 [Rhizobiales bacterium 32-66-11]|nr:MAG: hypothetical protein B7Y95_13175 [Rhizobiales bacterium 32-66-11]